MPSASYSATAQASVDALWARLADLPSWPRWLRAPYASEQVAVATPGTLGIGAEFSLKGPLTYRLFARVAEWEEGRRLALDIERSEYPSDRLFLRQARIEIELEPLADGLTRVTCAHRVEGKGALGAVYMATVFAPFLRSNVRLVVRSLIEAAET